MEEISTLTPTLTLTLTLTLVLEDLIGGDLKSLDLDLDLDFDLGLSSGDLNSLRMECVTGE